MKIVFSLLLVVVLSIGVIGCSMSEEQNAIAIAKQYKNLEYTVKDIRDISMDIEELNIYFESIYQQAKPLVLDKSYENLIRSGYFDKHRYNIIFNVTMSVKQIDFELYESNETELRYNYNLTLEIIQIDEGLTKEITKKGQMTLKLQDDNSWKITRDWTDFLRRDEVQFAN